MNSENSSGSQLRSLLTEETLNPPTNAELLLSTGLLSPYQASRIYEADPDTNLEMVAVLRGCHLDREAQLLTQDFNKAQRPKLLSRLGHATIGLMGAATYFLSSGNLKGFLATTAAGLLTDSVSSILLSKPNNSVSYPTQYQINTYARSFTPKEREINGNLRSSMKDIRDNSQFPENGSNQNDYELYADWFDEAKEAYDELLINESLRPEQYLALYMVEQIREVLTISCVAIYGENPDEDLIRRNASLDSLESALKSAKNV